MMDREIGVKITYRNEQLEPVYETTYTFRDYTEMLRADQLRQITDIEDAMYLANSNKPKEEWTDETWSAFCRIKHKLLDKAGDIGRLPDTVFEYKPEQTLSEFVAGVLNENKP